MDRPENASNGKLDGFELGLTYFPENLPGLWDGIGVISSATFLDSKQDIPVLNSVGDVIGLDSSPFFGVSDSSYSVTFAYERPDPDARLSYIWRDDALNRNEAALFANPIGIYRDAEESLDFQFSYNVTDELTVTFDATNLTEEFSQERYGNSHMHSHVNTLFSRTFAVGARYSYSSLERGSTFSFGRSSDRRLVARLFLAILILPKAQSSRNSRRFIAKTFGA